MSECACTCHDENALFVCLKCFMACCVDCRCGKCAPATNLPDLTAMWARVFEEGETNG